MLRTSGTAPPLVTDYSSGSWAMSAPPGSATGAKLLTNKGSSSAPVLLERMHTASGAVGTNRPIWMEF